MAKSGDTVYASLAKSGDTVYASLAKSGDTVYASLAKSGDTVYASLAKSGDTVYASLVKSGAVSIQWNGLLEWTTGMTLDLTFNHKTPIIEPIRVWDGLQSGLQVVSFDVSACEHVKSN